MSKAVSGWWTFGTAGQIIYGRGAAKLVGEAVKPFGRRVLVCADKQIEAAGLVRRILDSLSTVAGLEAEVLTLGEPEITAERAEACAVAAETLRPDVIIGLGGGSNIDLAKLVAARLGSGASIGEWLSGGKPTGSLPMVAIPTTAGTGSEVTSVAVVTNQATGTKVGITAPFLYPSRAIVDPAMTDTCPPKVTADSGIDALTHAIESYTAISHNDRLPSTLDQVGFVGKNPLSDTLAVEAIRLLGRYLPAVLVDGSDQEARDKVALAAMLAGLAFSSAGTGIVHALQYPLGALTHTSHGHGNALLLPAAVEHNLAVRRNEYGHVAHLMGCSIGDLGKAAEALPNLLRDFALNLGFVPGLTSIGISSADIGPMARIASKITRLTGNNPTPVSASDLENVLSRAL
jgi:alcohol dehydrogenase